MKSISTFLLWICTLSLFAIGEQPVLKYVVSMPEPSNHRFHTEFSISGLKADTVLLRMPKWSPGYYQLLDYAANVMNVTVSIDGVNVPIIKSDGNTWKVASMKGDLLVKYDVEANQQFVARSFLDDSHAYLVPANTCMYVVGMLNVPVSVEIKQRPNWKHVATGLEQVPGAMNVFSAPNYDILYDCPLLIGNLEELPAFEIKGIKHRFIGYNMGKFDGALLMKNLKRFIEAAAGMIGDIPYKEYTFIAIGQGNGGIEHLNNTTVSFNGARLVSEAAINDMILYLGHEYFHHYNVKRIRPFELGPFDYNKENRTTQLWISEGLTMYYEYVLSKRAGLMDEKKFLSSFAGHINSVQNNPGRLLQSMIQSSYGTWEDGPFTKRGQTISYYEKGPLNGLVIDLAIRRATKDMKSLDDVMRLVYETYYQKLQRGFTDAEFQHACETVAGSSLAKEFEYISTTKEIDYTDYLKHLGLELVNQAPQDAKSLKYSLQRSSTMDAGQLSALKSWLSE